MEKPVITIDGPAGAGKTTVSKMLASRLGLRYVDTGALYRGVAYEAVKMGLDLEDDAGLAALCQNLELSLVPAENGVKLISSGVDISGKIRTAEISMAASRVSARPVVRQYLLGLQKRLGREKGVVFEGRDMGTVVFPDADLKFFLSASVETRALRRYREMDINSGKSLEDIEKSIKQRDKNDSTRDLAPLKPAADAIMVDSTNLSIEEVVETMYMELFP